MWGCFWGRASLSEAGAWLLGRFVVLSILLPSHPLPKPRTHWGPLRPAFATPLLPLWVPSVFFVLGR